MSGEALAVYVDVVLIGGSAGGCVASVAPDMRLFKLALSLAGTTLLRMMAARCLAEDSPFGDCASDAGPDENASASIAGDVGEVWVENMNGCSRPRSAQHRHR